MKIKSSSRGLIFEQNACMQNAKLHDGTKSTFNMNKKPAYLRYLLASFTTDEIKYGKYKAAFQE